MIDIPCPITNSRSTFRVCISAITIVPFAVPKATLGLVSSNGDTYIWSNQHKMTIIKIRIHKWMSW